IYMAVECILAYCTYISPKIPVQLAKVHCLGPGQSLHQSQSIQLHIYRDKG
ncbi:Hypothetical predicted protein, partial [Marmota monax]